MISFRAGVDIGGTFTDIVLLGEDGARYTKKVSSTVDDYARAIAYLATGLWAYLELTEGVNWFRNLLGLAYVVSTVVHLALALKG